MRSELGRRLHLKFVLAVLAVGGIGWAATSSPIVVSKTTQTFVYTIRPGQAITPQSLKERLEKIVVEHRKQAAATTRPASNILLTVPTTPASQPSN